MVRDRRDECLSLAFTDRLSIQDMSIPKREEFVDYTKGIAALFVIFFHTWTHSNLLNGTLLFLASTHVPAFFLISGYLYNKYTITRTFQYRLKKMLNLIIVYLIYCAVLVITYMIARCFLEKGCGDAIIVLKQELWYDLHRMWYFPVLCAGMIVYEMLAKMSKCVYGVGILCYISGMVACLFYLPIVGKPMVYILVFFMGTKISFNKFLGTVMLLIDVLVWLVLVVFTGQVELSNEALRGKPLILLELLILFGSFFVPYICFFIQKYIQQMTIVSSILKYFGKNSQLVYFSHFWLVVVVEAFLECNNIYRLPFYVSLLYSLAGIVFFVLLERVINKYGLLKRILLNPIV